MTPTTYGRDFAYCLKSHGGVRGFNASLWQFLLRCTLFCHSVATFLTSVSSYEGGCGFEVREAFGSFKAISRQIFTSGADCYVSLRMTTLVRLDSKYAPF